MMKSFELKIPAPQTLAHTAELARERELQRIAYQKARFKEDIPQFFEFITKQLERKALDGQNRLHINFDDESWPVKDDRIAFRFKGYCSNESQEIIEDFFNATFKEIMGYDGYIYFLWNSTYRLGELELRW